MRCIIMNGFKFMVITPILHINYGIIFIEMDEETCFSYDISNLEIR